MAHSVATVARTPGAAARCRGRGRGRGRGRAAARAPPRAAAGRWWSYVTGAGDAQAAAVEDAGPAAPAGPADSTWVRVTAPMNTTLDEFAAMHGTTVAALREMNGKKAMKKAQRGLGGNRIDGADLLVPAEGAETTGPVRMVIPRGGSIYDVAAEADLPISAILKANPQIENPEKVFAGETIVLPAKGSFAVSGSTAVSGSAVVPVKATTGAPMTAAFATGLAVATAAAYTHTSIMAKRRATTGTSSPTQAPKPVAVASRLREEVALEPAEVKAPEPAVAAPTPVPAAALKPVVAVATEEADPFIARLEAAGRRQPAEAAAPEPAVAAAPEPAVAAAPAPVSAAAAPEAEEVDPFIARLEAAGRREPAVAAAPEPAVAAAPEPAVAAAPAPVSAAAAPEAEEVDPFIARLEAAGRRKPAEDEDEEPQDKWTLPELKSKEAAKVYEEA